MLEKAQSLCSKKQKIIVSKDNKNSRKHIAVNSAQNLVGQYRLDGDVIKQETACDFLVLNDDKKVAYFIELKGSDVNKAAKQINSSIEKLKKKLEGYTIYCRIVCTKVRTNNIKGTDYRKLKEKYHNKVLCRENELKEDI